MKHLLLLSTLAVSQISATPVSINYTNLFYANGGSQIGTFGNFAVRNVRVTTDSANTNVGIQVNFNFGNNTLNPYAFAGTTIAASDLFFRNSANTIVYGIPLVGRASNFMINGVNTTGANSTQAGRLYQISAPAINDGLFYSQDLGYTANFGQSGYGFGRAVLIDRTNSSFTSTTGLLAAPTVVFNGACSTNGCTPEFTVSFAFSNVGTDLRNAFATGALTPYFTGSTCGNDLVSGQIPEPGSVVLMSSALVLIGLRLRRKK